MITKGYMVLEVKRNSKGQPLKVIPQRVTQRFPSPRYAGDIIVAFELDLDQRVINPQVLVGKVPPRAAMIALEVKDNDQ